MSVHAREAAPDMVFVTEPIGVLFGLVDFPHSLRGFEEIDPHKEFPRYLTRTSFDRKESMLK
jgi:hypothetical protein